MTRGDVRTVYGVQALRAFAYGAVSVVLGTVLADAGLDSARIGVVFSAMLTGMAVATIAVGLRGHRVHGRTLYVSLLTVMAAAGAVVALSTELPLLLIAALTGTLSTDPNESGPISSLEHAMLGGVDDADRPRVFGRYNGIAYLAGSAGALAAGGPPARIVLLTLPAAAIASAMLATRLRTASAPAPARTPLGRSRPTVRRLSVLFAVDATAGGFTVQAFIAYWFARRFGASAAQVGALFSVVGLLQGLSSFASGWLGARIGLLQTMVFTHLPSNVLLAAVPLMPTFPLAAAVLLARSALSQMDVPARQAYVAAIVDPDERVAAAAFTNAVRYVARPAGPAAAGVLLQHAWIGAPFIVSGGLKIVYDLALYARFRASGAGRPASPRRA